LLPDGETRRARFRLSAGAVLILAGVALTKIVIAFARGRTNVEFLAVLMIASFIAVCVVGNATRTAGMPCQPDQDAVPWLNRAASTFRGETNELARSGPPYGSGGSILFPYVGKLQPKKRTSDGGGCGSSCSSCSSCGGGGCGGGCGGCGS
jgi:uncharacterized membrane protein YgcG